MFPQAVPTSACALMAHSEQSKSSGWREGKVFIQIKVPLLIKKVARVVNLPLAGGRDFTLGLSSLPLCVFHSVYKKYTFSSSLELYN